VIPRLEADDIVTALKASTTPDQMPILHLWDNQPDARERAPARVADLTIKVAEELRRGYEAVIADHVESARRSSWRAVEDASESCAAMSFTARASCRVQGEALLEGPAAWWDWMGCRPARGGV
jgi:hypothetical protein